ncbi:MAG TPA: hypothetical protein VFO20_13905 [Propionibacteriaceae bacterium]|nr:hypothetical protein [Propionibacteriaceae bacterium]
MNVETVTTDVTHRRGVTRHFVRHYIEMVIAMIVGMVALGAAVSMIFAVLGHSSLLHFAGLRAFLMTTYMTVGMSLWMRYRGHSWARVGEMAAAMFAPLIVLIVPFWTGLLSAGTLLVATHVLMLPAMFVVMLMRRSEYSQDHRQHARHQAEPGTSPGVMHS